MDERTINTSLRLPAELHDRLRRQAARQDRSAHWLILRYIQRGLEQDEREQGGEGR
jgi:predicted DNA-binding protein